MANIKLTAAEVHSMMSKLCDETVKLQDLLGDAEKALQASRQQIEYLHKKFKETGSGNAVIAQVDGVLASIKERAK